ncbi:hypothetical protein [Planobispora takensis]|uniref:Uncharacterized protein n=1 Tax=Planobispora takensis TaxID=1367882 RepID=A0A8J3WSE2_9ACTN|nr:hypothetical protein [Planobispora takensis]GII00266.1 hypothetical protein Pta02_22740 [Planobispora takensis]
MLELLLLAAVLAPAPLLAVAVLAVRLRQAVRRGGAGALAVGARAAWRQGTARPVWPGLVAVAAVAAVLTAGLERLYLATVANGPRWGFDVALLTVVLGLPAAVGYGALAALAAAAVTRARGFGAGTVAGLLTPVAALVAVLAVGVPEAVLWAHRKAGYLSTGDAVPPTWQAAVLDVLRPEFLAGMIALWAAGMAGGAALGAVVGTASGRPRTGASATASSALRGIRPGDPSAG